MKKFNMICSVVAVITTAILLITLAQNITVRSSELYTFYFNDSRAVAYLYTDLTANEVADGITDFMGAWKPEEFQIYEDTGYDLQGIFDEDESYNMMRVKQGVDISAVLCLVSLILTIAIYWNLIRCGEKKMLKYGFRISFVLTFAVSAAEVFLLKTESGMNWLAEFMHMKSLEENSALMTILGPEFLSMAAIFLAGISVVILAVTAYLNYRLTKPERIFY